MVTRVAARGALLLHAASRTPAAPSIAQAVMCSSVQRRAAVQLHAQAATCCWRRAQLSNGTRGSRLVVARHGPNGPHQHHQHHQHHHDHYQHGTAKTLEDGVRPLSHAEEHHHHDHDDHAHAHFPETALSRALERVGLVQLAHSMSHSAACMGWAIACYLVSLLMGVPLVTDLLPAALPTALRTASLAAAFVLSGLPQVVEAACIAAAGIVDTHVLMALAAFGTLYMGMAQEGALLLILFQLSHTLEEKLTERAKGSLTRLFASLPEQAVAVDVDPETGAPVLMSARSVPVRRVELGSTVLFKAGEEAPLDGVIVWGSASVSLQHISGESVPLLLEPGAEVPAGSRNLDGLLVLRVLAGIEESTPARIARMAAQAQEDKPQLSRLLDTIGGVWSKAVIGATLATLAVLVATGVPLLAPGGALYRAMGVLTAGSPCAVVLVPMAYVCAIATITRRGVLVRSGAALDALLSCKTLALDKTGTITSGQLTLAEAAVAVLWPTQEQQQHSVLQDGGALQPVPLQVLAPPPPTSEPATSARRAGGPGQEASPGAHSTASSPAGGDALPGQVAFARRALAYAVALSRASTHPVAKALVRMADDHHHDHHDHHGYHRGAEHHDHLHHHVQLSHFLQVPGMGVQGVCEIAATDFGPGQGEDAAPGADGAPVLVHFGSLAYVQTILPAGSKHQELLQRLAKAKAESCAARATSILMVTPLSSGLAPGSSAPEAQVGAADPVHVAFFSFEDQVAPGVAQAVQAIQAGTWRSPNADPSSSDVRRHPEDCLDVVMLTGDSAAVAQHVARTVGISSWRAGMKPEDKLAYVQQHDASHDSKDGVPQQQGQQRHKAAAEHGGLVMVGDGINDAPALAAARVGVAVASTPSDMVAAAADILLLNGQGVSNLPWLLAVAHKTRAVTRQNLAIALTAVVVATLPTVAGIFPLWLAVLLHEGSTLLVALNSLRLLLDPGVSSLPVALAGAAAAARSLISTAGQQPPSAPPPAPSSPSSPAARVTTHTLAPGVHVTHKAVQQRQDQGNAAGTSSPPEGGRDHITEQRAVVVAKSS